MEWSMGDGLTEQNLKPERARWTEEMQSHPETQLEAPSFLLPFILLLSLCLENTTCRDEPFPKQLPEGWLVVSQTTPQFCDLQRNHFFYFLFCIWVWH